MISAAFIDIFRDGGWYIRKRKYCHGFQWYVKGNCYFKVKTCQTKFTPLLKRRVKAPMWAKNAKSGLQKPTSSCRALVMPLGLEISGDFLIFVTRTEEVILSLLKYTGLWIVLKKKNDHWNTEYHFIKELNRVLWSADEKPNWMWPFKWKLLGCTFCCTTGDSNIWVCGWNLKVWPFKWKL